MSVNFFEATCSDVSSEKLFGLCDDPPPSNERAYIDETDGSKWIAVVNNEYKSEVTFTAIDNCIELLRPDGKAAQRCDGMLTTGDTVIFVELKERGQKGWVKDAEEQLLSTISYWEKTEDSEEFFSKKAYIANSLRPKFRSSQSVRMEKFLDTTGYVLRIERRINIE